MIARKDYEKIYTKKLKREMVALYDTDAISEEEVDRVIRWDTYHKDVVLIDKEQFNSVFRELIAKNAEKKETKDI